MLEVNQLFLKKSDISHVDIENKIGMSSRILGSWMLLLLNASLRSFDSIPFFFFLIIRPASLARWADTRAVSSSLFLNEIRRIKAFQTVFICNSTHPTHLGGKQTKFYPFSPSKRKEKRRKTEEHHARNEREVDCHFPVVSAENPGGTPSAYSSRFSFLFNISFGFLWLLSSAFLYFFIYGPSFCLFLWFGLLFKQGNAFVIAQNSFTERERERGCTFSGKIKGRESRI